MLKPGPWTGYPRIHKLSTNLFIPEKGQYSTLTANRSRYDLPPRASGRRLGIGEEGNISPASYGQRIVQQCDDQRGDSARCQSGAKTGCGAT